MAAFIVSLVVLSAMFGHSYAAYCLCRDGVGQAALQKSIDFACGHGADCSSILQNGACYNPNTVKDHCNWAVNSYYQRQGQTADSCNFSGSATVSQTAPPGTSGCVYPNSPSNAGTSTSTTPSTNPTSSSTTGTGGTTTIPGSTGTTGFGLAPTGGINNPDSSTASVTLHQAYNLFISISLALVFSGLLMC